MSGSVADGRNSPFWAYAKHISKMMLSSDKCYEAQEVRKGEKDWEKGPEKAFEKWHVSKILKWRHEPWVFGKKDILLCSAKTLRQNTFGRTQETSERLVWLEQSERVG